PTREGPRAAGSSNERRTWDTAASVPVRRQAVVGGTWSSERLSISCFRARVGSPLDREGCGHPSGHLARRDLVLERDRVEAVLAASRRLALRVHQEGEGGAGRARQAQVVAVVEGHV